MKPLFCHNRSVFVVRQSAIDDVFCLLLTQRDRQLIKDLLGEMEKYRARNHKEKEEREKEEARRIHEASHNVCSSEGRPDAVLPSSGSV